MESPSRPLEIFFLPWPASGHIIPLTEMARLFAACGQHMTIITTPANAQLLQKGIDKDAASGHHIRILLLDFPSDAVGLPAGLESFSAVTDMDTASKLYRGVALLRPQIESLIIKLQPDCIVSDMFFPWTVDVAARLGIPRFLFNGMSIFALTLEHCLKRSDSPHRSAESDSEPFTIQGLPDPITMTRSQLPDYLRKPTEFSESIEEQRKADLKSFGILVNGIRELELNYIEPYKKIMNYYKVYHIGPTALIHRNTEDKAERSFSTVIGQHECLSWLDSKNPKTVLYICFGSGGRFPDNQLFEIACALKASGHPFIWVVLGKNRDETDQDRAEWLPEGFEDWMKEEDRGIIVRGWAPQILILDHPAIGGFLTHCGWNATLEAITAGVPMATWPLFSEQFYNEAMITQVLGIGVEVGARDWCLWVHVGWRLIGREMIERAVRRLMDGSEVAAEMRRRVQELAEVAKKALEEGGSSHRNLTTLIEELKQVRANRIGHT